MATADNSNLKEAPQIPDHELIRCIGEGSYGDVWLAKSVMGTFRGVKIVSRKSFGEDRPFEREFAGIQKFEPVSRTHPGFVAILHVGRNPAGKYFYYVMEVADDIVQGQSIDPGTYTPRTLKSERKQHGRLPPGECLHIGLSLTTALAHLHRNGLIHRDIKPSNIIFVGGVPKFADVGLVTNIGEAATFVGTQGFLPPEGPGRPTGDIYSLGMLLYELAMGKDADEYPELPTQIEDRTQSPELWRLNKVILRACEKEAPSRFQSAEEMHAALGAIGPAVGYSAIPALSSATHYATDWAELFHSPNSSGATLLQKPLDICIIYKSDLQPDAQVVDLLNSWLTEQGCTVFFDRHLAIGTEWAHEIESRIRRSDAAIILLSATSIQSEMIAFEVELANEAAQERSGKPRLFPVRINCTEPLLGTMAGILDPLQHFLWEAPAHDERLIRELTSALSENSQKPKTRQASLKLESVGGAVPLDSRFYITRTTDHEFQEALARRDSIVLVKGARQMGKTSLLARGLQHARSSGANVVLTDFQKLNTAHLVSAESFFITVAEILAEQLDLKVFPADSWDERRSPNTNFERYLRREVLEKISGHFVWGLDEVDRLFACDFGSEVFGLFRSWHNERALDPSGPRSRLTMAIAYATEAHLFITDVNQSPFNVGTRLDLDDFTLAEVSELNERYGSPLRTSPELARFFALVGGQPYLARRGLNELATGHLSFADFSTKTNRDDGIFGDHLRRILVLLARDAELTAAVRGLLRAQTSLTEVSFYRLRSAGVMSGDSAQQSRFRCEIYTSYLRRHLL